VKAWLWVGTSGIVPTPFLCEGAVYILLGRMGWKKKWKGYSLFSSQREAFGNAERVFRMGADAMVVRADISAMVEHDLDDGSEPCFPRIIWRKVHP
jgi:hypothetical protein